MSPITEGYKTTSIFGSFPTFEDPEEATVATPSRSYRQMAADWLPIEDLLGGTERMRDVALSSHRWLPAMPRESTTAYRHRVEGSFLHEMLADTLAKLKARPFSKRVTWDDGMPDHLLALVDDMDLSGSTLHSFAESWFLDGMTYGLAHALVDFTRMPDGGPLIAGQERALGARSRIVRISPKSLISVSPGSDGNEADIEEARILGDRSVRVGRWGERIESLVLVYRKDGIQTFRQVQKFGDGSTPVTIEWEPDGPVLPNTLGRVPLVTWYTGRISFHLAKPPFLPLAWTNIDHWQSYSDQRNILHVGRVPIIFRSGVDRQEMEREAKLVVGPSREVRTSNEKANMKYVEPAGAAMQAGDQHLKSLEAHAAELGQQPLQPRGRTPLSAQGVQSDDSKVTCALQSWIQNEEAALTQAFRLAGAWERTKPQLPDDFSFHIFQDFDLGQRSAGELMEIGHDYDRGLITEHRALKERKRRGLYGDDMNIEEELKDAPLEPRNLTMALAPARASGAEESETTS